MSVIYNIRSTSKEPKTTGTAKQSKSCGGSGRGFIKVLNRRATEFDTRAKNWQGPEGLPPLGGSGACSLGKF